MLSRGTLIFDHGLTLRSYIESGALSDIKSRLDTSIIIIDRKVPRSYLDELIALNVEVTLVHSTKMVRFLTYLHSLSYWIRRQDACNGFASRLRSIRRGRREFYDGEDNFDLNLRNSIKNRVKFAFASMLKQGLPRWILVILGFLTFAKVKRADHFYFITVGGAESLGDILSVYLKKRFVNSRFYYITENWDNLETKAVIWRKPDRIGTWEYVDHLKMAKIHKMSSSDIVFVGSPRLTSISKRVISSRTAKINNLYPELTLYACGGSNFEIENKRFRNVLPTIQNVIGNPIIFLPHPRSYGEYLQWRENSPSNNFQQGMLDVQIAECYKEEEFLPLEILADLMCNTSLLLSSLSTMAIEAASLGISTIVIDISETIEGETVWATDYFDYFSALKRNEFVKILRDDSDLSSILQSFSQSTRVYSEIDFEDDSPLIKSNFLERFVGIQRNTEL